MPRVAKPSATFKDLRVSTYTSKQDPMLLLTRALLGLWIFHRLLGGGAFERPP